MEKSRLSSVAAGVAAALAGMAAVGVRRSARRTGISASAFLANSLAARFAPDQNDLSHFEEEIAKDRQRGPALPPRSLRKRTDFTDTLVGEDRVIRLRPKGADTGLWLLYLHGGAYVHEVQSIQWNLAAGLFKRLSAGVVAPVYPLAPEQSWREGLGAVERVYRTLAEEVGAENVAIFGDSAGGGLALTLAQRLRDAGHPLPAALVLFSPWLDVGVSGADQPDLEKRDPVLRIKFLRHAGQLWARDLPLDDPRVSPLFGNHSDLPPTIVFSGDRDILASDALRLAERNPAIVHRHYPEMMHVWAAAPVPEGRRALDEAAAFIREHTAAPA